ncbi:MAG: hypothetical protein H6605_10855 [Flavobacteriales bacterium]|nr:hypothetical protein [Flavobacteriales bacterium]
MKSNSAVAIIAALVLPNLLFLATWFSWYVWVPAVVVIIGLFLNLEIEHIKYRPKGKLILYLNLVFSLYLVYLSGTCNLSSQTFDFVKHHLITSDLVNRSWPVIYQSGYYLSYNIGYYLIPSALAKLTVAGWAEYFLFAELFIGVFLTLSYLQQFVVKNPFYAYLILILPNSFLWVKEFFDAIDFYQFRHGKDIGFIMRNYLFDHPFYLEASTLITQLYFVPQHFMALVLSGCLLHYSWNTNNLQVSALVCCMLPVWSVFIAFAALLLFMLQLLINYKPALKKVRILLPYAILFFLITSYYNGHSRPGFLRFWQMSGEQLREITLFFSMLLIPYLIFTLFYFLSSKEKRIRSFSGNARSLYFSAFLLLPFFLVFYQFDFMLRGVSFYLFLLNLWVIGNLHQFKKAFRYAFVLIFSVGGILQLFYKPYFDHTSGLSRYNFKEFNYYLNSGQNIQDMEYYHQESTKYQYLSDTGKSVYYRYLRP